MYDRKQDRRMNIGTKKTHAQLMELRMSETGIKLSCNACTCPAYHTVPAGWKDFLHDQRGPRKQVTTLSDKSLSLRASSNLQVSQEEMKARQHERWKAEIKSRREAQERLAMERAEHEKEILFQKVSADSIDWNEIDADNAASSDSSSEESSAADSDSDWEDIDEDTKTPEYNTLKLKNFARECDRYKESNRAGAKLANALLKDLKIVTKQDCSKLICPGKLRRERLKWGGELEKAHSAKVHPGGLYSDGKKCPTLVRDTSYVQVQVIRLIVSTSLRLVDTILKINSKS